MNYVSPFSANLIVKQLSFSSALSSKDFAWRWNRAWVALIVWNRIFSAFSQLMNQGLELKSSCRQRQHEKTFICQATAYIYFLLILFEVNNLCKYFRVFNDVGGKKCDLMSDEGNEKRALKLCKYFSESFEILKLAKHSQFWNLFTQC